MTSVVLIMCALGLGAPAPSAEEAALQVAIGKDGADENLRALMRKGRFGLQALISVARKSEGEPRRRAYEAIGAFRGEAAYTALLEGIHTSDRYAQLGAVRGLARLGSSEAIEPLLQTAMTPDEDVRKEIVEALMTFGSAARAASMKVARSASPYARETATRYLARSAKGDDRREHILRGLKDGEANVREAAVELAEQWRDMSLAEALVELTRDEDADVAARAVEAVARFPTLRKELPSLLSDPRVTRQAWMTAFHRMRDYDDMAVPYLIVAVAKAEPKRQAIMLDLLAVDASETELQAFVDLLDSPEEDVTDVVTGLLEQMGGRADTAAARMVLNERDSLVEAIRNYLGSRPRHGITDEILRSAKEGTTEDRTRHIAIIGELDASEVREDLVDLLGDTEKEVRVAAARALGGLNDVGAEAELVRLLEDPNDEVRVESVRGLTAYGSRLSVLARMTAIEDPNPEVRKAAMDSFRGSGADSVLDALERVVRSGEPSERLAALSAIAEVKTVRAAVLLVDLVTDEDEAIRMAASAYFQTLPKLDPIYENAGVGMVPDEISREQMAKSAP